MGIAEIDPLHWFDFAEKDLVRAHRRFGAGDLNDCPFYPRQCAQKTMKGNLIALGWPLRKIHDLAPLIPELAGSGVDCAWSAKTADALATQDIANCYLRFEGALSTRTELHTLVQNTTKLFELLTAR